ncbi:alpha/beta hydrolase [Haloferax mediterranei ATCC 33500]|uniref:Alpha/beta hydrolase n=1 Tax=Haloferax mediterranei (strain ATCC 33500 / DSM 1411 / JCM 8866 / NBRC 14739 / NCIMB 2177 / R-4) TaxID=523841 RepID=I3R7I6_HALMT|nr:alpha/beta hydrolase [Haloferax mediterranei]AFK20196.2 epoxide hydrolase-related protein [Haloferax mediterranei ATCC 33500]AHZ23571.1 alpha/beta hydrolase [Haloferax mediterranei ATCC 33500]ELZ99055.1 epoxide hydrolase-related protein [Haloferax mediterranei ATCC 33500]MDX5987047.1 alpha/beta hydrolase [Haloferax mediterranei ATCC 33500]QCQ76365.1 alpha/beta hydrolase [Haloferax mediterranei ATCC 33500]
MSDQSGLACDDVQLLVEATGRRIDVGDVTLHAVEAGPEDGELVVLLHGFPECWYAWADYLRPLTDAGYRVVVPDQRGYNLSDHPEGIEWYSIDELASDIVGLLDALDREKAHIVGHDSGAAVAWWTSLHHPDRVRSLTTINVPHPTVFARHLKRDPAQQLRSWYMLFFQVPKLPELIAPLGDWAVLERTMTDSALPGTFSTAELEHYRSAWSVPGAYQSMVNWYRAAVRERPQPRTETVEVPTLVVWGSRDRFLRSKMARESLSFCSDGHLRMFDEATHWVHHEEPVAVARAIIEHVDDAWRTPNNTPDETSHRPV